MLPIFNGRNYSVKRNFWADSNVIFSKNDPNCLEKHCTRRYQQHGFVLTLKSRFLLSFTSFLIFSRNVPYSDS